MTQINTSTEAVMALLKGVTPGPWTADAAFMSKDQKRRLAMPDRHGVPMATIAEFEENWNDCEGGGVRRISWKEAEANASFVAAARELVPALLAERDEANARAEAAERHVAGNEINWRDDPTAIVEDDTPMIGRDYA